MFQVSEPSNKILTTFVIPSESVYRVHLDHCAQKHTAGAVSRMKNKTARKFLMSGNGNGF